MIAIWSWVLAWPLIANRVADYEQAEEDSASSSEDKLSLEKEEIYDF